MARNPKMQAKKKERRILYFAKSDRVEVEHLHNTISRAWFEATIRKTHLQTGRYTVIYNTLYLPDGRRLYDVIDSCHVRPVPPSNTTTSSSSITTNQKVEVFHNDGWWIGVVISKLDDTDGGKFLVSLPNSNGEDEKIEFASSRIRVHLDWDSSNDKWVLVENEDAMPETEEKKHGHDQKPKMPCAMNVIVLSDDD